MSDKRVIIGPYGETRIYHSQLTIWASCGTSCAILCDTSITQQTSTRFWSALAFYFFNEDICKTCRHPWKSEMWRYKTPFGTLPILNESLYRQHRHHQGQSIHTHEYIRNVANISRARGGAMIFCLRGPNFSTNILVLS